MNQIVKDLDINVAKAQVEVAVAKSATPISKLQAGLELTFAKTQLITTTNDDGSKKDITRLIFRTSSDEEMRLTTNLVAKFKGVKDIFSGAFKIKNVEMQPDGIWVQEVEVEPIVAEVIQEVEQNTATSQA